MTYPTKWNLARYFYTGLDDPKLAADIANILPTTEKFSKQYEQTFHTFTTPEQILWFYSDYTAMSHDMATPSYYLFYRSSLDTQDLAVTKRMGEVDYIYTEASNQMLWVAQWWKAIGYDQIMDWSHDPKLAQYKNDLLSTADGIKYILGEAEEKVLNLKSRPLSLANSLHDELTGSYEFTMTIDGEEKKLTEEEVRSYRQHTDRNIRRESYESLRRVYNSKQTQISLGNIYTSIVKDWSSEITMRGYPDTVMAQRNISEEMDDEVVDMLLSEVEKAYPLYQRFLNIKSKMLGLEGDLKVWDVSAPVWDASRKVEFTEAMDIHLAMMKEFDSEFYDYSLDMIEWERIDVFPAAGKRGGAYASYRKNDESFILLNFQNKVSDIWALSHELGHAIHGHLSQAQEDPVYDSGIPMAETASLFSEMLLSEYMPKILNIEEQKSYFDTRLLDTFGNIMRSTMYTRFEKRVHTNIHAWEELNYRDLNIAWRDEQVKLSGDIVHYDLPPEEDSGWSMIPHIFHSPFYCYGYAFGFIMVFALYARYKADPAFKEDYKDILRSGGSERPRDLLARYAIDIASPEFYQSGLREVERMVEEFENLV